MTCQVFTKGKGEVDTQAEPSKTCFCISTLGIYGNSRLHCMEERFSTPSHLFLLLAFTVLAVCKIKVFLGKRRSLVALLLGDAGGTSA